MNLFATEREANEYREKRQLFGRVAEYVEGTGKLALNFPIEAHVTVVEPSFADIVDVPQMIDT